MENIENILENIMNGSDGGDSLVSAAYENPDDPIVDPLKVNDLNPNFIILINSSGSERDYVESGDIPPQCLY